MIGAILQKERKARGLSLGKLALRAGIHKGTLSRWESGKNLPSTHELTQVMEALELSASTRLEFWQSLEAPRSLEAIRQESGASGAPVTSGELLRALRERSGLSQAEAARTTGVSRALLSQWERDHCWPDGERLHALCWALGATLEEVSFLTTRGWKQLEPLPDDKDALDAVVNYLEYYDVSRNRGLVYLALAGRYQTLHQQGKLSAVDAMGIWGSYGHYIAWRLERYDDALRVAAPALATLRGSSRPVTRGQLEAINALALVERHTPHRTGVLPLLAEVSPRVPSEHRSWRLSIHSETLASMGHIQQAATLYVEAIRSASRQVDSNQYAMRYVEMLCRTERYREAHAYLTPPDPYEVRPLVILKNILNHAWVLAGLDERSEAQRFLGQASAVQKRYGLEVGEDILRLEHWLSA